MAALFLKVGQMEFAVYAWPAANGVRAEVIFNNG